MIKAMLLRNPTKEENIVEEEERTGKGRRKKK